MYLVFDHRSPSGDKQKFLHLVGTIMEHLLEGIAPLRHGYINQIVKM